MAVVGDMYPYTDSIADVVMTQDRTATSHPDVGIAVFKDAVSFEQTPACWRKRELD